MKYIGLLRAVNVGGKNKIRMAELRGVLEAMGLQQVRTYIQSGNMLFDSDAPEDALRHELEHQIAQRFGFHVDVVLRTVVEFDRLVADCPYLGSSESASSLSLAPEGLSVAFYDAAPPPEVVARLSRYLASGEQYQAVGRDVYVLLPQGTARSKVVAQVQNMGPVVTIRNWNTVEKLHTLAHEQPDGSG